MKPKLTAPVGNLSYSLRCVYRTGWGSLILKAGSKKMAVLVGNIFLYVLSELLERQLEQPFHLK